MATKAFTTFIPCGPKGENMPGCLGVKWVGLANGDDGAPFVCSHRADKCVMAYGTPGAAPHILIEGTNEQVYGPDGSALGAPTYVTLVDPSSAALDFITSPRIEQVLENPLAIRPRVSAGDGTTNWTVTMIVASPARL